MIKAPKLRYLIGSFLQAKRDVHHFAKKGEIFCITLAFRLKANPHEWLYQIEARKDIYNPETILSLLCKAEGYIPNHNRVIYEPVTGILDHRVLAVTQNDFGYGDSMTVSTKELINDFVLISSGEIYSPNQTKTLPNILKLNSGI